jgi:3',5'-cyclic AMP phosphodiesterase CpdA
MRVAVVSDIHGNLTAFDAVLADIRQCSPDLVLHAGDLADSGSSPTEIVDRIRDLGWPGVMGNTDEMLVHPYSLEDFASQSSAPPDLWTAVRQIALATRDKLAEERLAWLRELPRVKAVEDFALVHATPECCWRPRQKRPIPSWRPSMVLLASPLLSSGIRIALPFAALLGTQDS